MSDARVRELERRWRETGAVADEASHLLERLRVGGLPRERLELAASCGHEAARLATGLQTVDLATLLARLDREPQPLPVVAALACAMLTFSRWEVGSRAELAPRAAIDAARGWLIEPSEARQRQAWEAGCQSCDLARPSLDISYRSAAWCAAMPALLTADLPTRLRLMSTSTRSSLDMGHNLGLMSIMQSCSVTGTARHARGAGVTATAIRVAVRDAAATWALTAGVRPIVWNSKASEGPRSSASGHCR